MRPLSSLLVFCAGLSVVSAQAQSSRSAPPDLSVTTPAPVPNVRQLDVAPANRVAGAGPGGQAHAAGPAYGTPFSSTPSGMGGIGLSGPRSRQDQGGGAVTVPYMGK